MSPAPIVKAPRARKLAAALALLAIVAGGTPPAAAADGEKAPFEWIRVLRRQQEKVAAGAPGAQAALVSLMGQIETRFLAADTVNWRDPRNARAAVLYLFSGGRPQVVRSVLAHATMPPVSDRLVKGALAYAEGQDQIARDLLDPIDPRAEAPALGGQLALVKATLVAASDPKKADTLLGIARLLLPGSLVEEAALRRQIAMQTDPAALGRFVTLSRQYLRRYPASIYAENFKQHFAVTAVDIAGTGDVVRLGALDPAVAELPAAEQRALYLAMARAALVKGQTVAARVCASRAATIAKETAQDAARAKLYLDAAAIVGDDVAKGVAALEAVDGSRLSPEDAEFRDAALAVAHSVQAPVGDPTEGANPSADPDSAALLQQAHAALSGGAALLDKAQ